MDLQRAHLAERTALVTLRRTAVCNNPRLDDNDSVTTGNSLKQTDFRSEDLFNGMMKEVVKSQRSKVQARAQLSIISQKPFKPRETQRPPHPAGRGAAGSDRGRGGNRGGGRGRGGGKRKYQETDIGKDNTKIAKKDHNVDKNVNVNKESS